MLNPGVGGGILPKVSSTGDNFCQVINGASFVVGLCDVVEEAVGAVSDCAGNKLSSFFIFGQYLRKS